MLIRPGRIGRFQTAPRAAPGGITPPTGYVFLTRADGTYLTRPNGAFLLRAA